MDTSPSFQQLSFRSSRFNDQSRSPLFHLPTEIRSQIWKATLETSQSFTHEYHKISSWRRPGCKGPKRSYTQILRTCKRIYGEAWSYMYKDFDLTIYLTPFRYRPLDCINPYVLEERLLQYRNVHGSDLDIEHLQVFAAERETDCVDCSLSSLTRMGHLSPRKITLTFRYVDTKDWEYARQMWIGAAFVLECIFPSSVQEIVVEYESLESRWAEAELLMRRAATEWYFQRKDGVFLTAEYTRPKLQTWTGCSTLNDTRWIRDEARPNELDYVVVSYTWDARIKQDESQRHQNTLHSRKPFYPTVDCLIPTTPAGDTRPYLHTTSSEPRRLWRFLSSSNHFGRILWSEPDRQERNPEVCVKDHQLLGPQMLSILAAGGTGRGQEPVYSESGKRLIIGPNLDSQWSPYSKDDRFFYITAHDKADKQWLKRFRWEIERERYGNFNVGYLIPFMRMKWLEWKLTGKAETPCIIEFQYHYQRPHPRFSRRDE